MLATLDLFLVHVHLCAILLPDGESKVMQDGGKVMFLGTSSRFHIPYCEVVRLHVSWTRRCQVSSMPA